MWTSFRSKARQVSLAVSIGAVFCLAAAEQAVVGIASLWTLHLAPVALAGWFGGRWPAVAVAVASATGWIAASLLTGELAVQPTLAAMDIAVRLMVLLSAGIAVSAWRRSTQLQYQVHRTDALTGALTEPAFREQVELEVARSSRYERPFTVAYISVDNLQSVTHLLGAAAADATLREAANIIRQDLRTTDIVARVRNTEFALLLPETDDAGSNVVLERLLRGLKEARAVDVRVRPTFSVGAVTWVRSDLNTQQLLQQAYQHLYTARRHHEGALLHEVLTNPVRDGTEAHRADHAA